MSNRQDEIVATALQLISNEGIQELTMKKIAAAIGITEPALYRHFASKSRILSAVVDKLAAARSALLTEAALRGPDVESMVTSFFVGHARLFTQEPAMTVILFSEDLFRNDAELSDRVAMVIADTKERIESALSSGVASGLLRTDLDLPTATLLLVGGFRQLVSSWRLNGYRFQLEEQTDHFVKSSMRLLSRAGAS